MLAKRVATAAVGIPVLGWFAYIGGFVWAVTAGLLCGVTAWEFLRFSSHPSRNDIDSWPCWSDWTVILAGPVLASAMVLPGSEAVCAVFGALVVLTVVAGLSKSAPSGITTGLGRILIAAVFIIAPAAAMVHLRQGVLGFETLATLAISIWALDTGAYFAGRALGRHPFHRYSPKKTWEGAAGGTLSAVAVTLVSWKYGYIAPAAVKAGITGTVANAVGAGQYPGWLWAAGFGLVIAFAGQAGDLLESGLKRDWEIKDSSGFLPGHGGFYDRFDSLLLAAPAVVLYLGAF